MLWHFVDGPEQEVRDRAMRLEDEGRPLDESPNRWSGPVTQGWCFDHDAQEVLAEDVRECFGERLIVKQIR